MIARLSQSGLLWSTAASIVAFCVLIALGNWQWQRMHWKQGLIEELKLATSAKPTEMRTLPGRDAETIAEAAAGQAVQALQFRRIILAGVFMHDLEMHVWAPTPRGPTWSVVTPMQLRPVPGEAKASAASATHVLVIRGTVPAGKKDPASRLEGNGSEEQSVTGRVRLDQPNTWANEPNIKTNEWFTRDLAAMAKHIQASKPNVIRFAPFFLEAEEALARPHAPQPDLKALKLSNRHLEYALTWWALAATLLGVFAVFAVGRLKAPVN